MTAALLRLIRAHRAALPVFAFFIVARVALAPARAAEPLAAAQPFLDQHCSACHNDVDLEAKLDLTTLVYDPKNPANLALWMKIHDRVERGEMPPKKRTRPAPSELESFVHQLGSAVSADERAIIARDGRTLQRRLNAYEYENALRDLFQAPWLQVKGGLPDDGVAFRFNKSGKALDVSHVQISRFMSIADTAIRQAISVQAARPLTTTRRTYARDQKFLTKEFIQSVMNTWPDRQTTPLIGTAAQPEVRQRREPLTVGAADPAQRDLEAVAWPSIAFPKWDRIPIPVAGHYRVRMSGYTVWFGPYGYSKSFTSERDRVGKTNPPRWYSANLDDLSPGRRDEPVSVYATGAGTSRRVGGFDLTPEPAVHELEMWLGANESVMPKATRIYQPRPPNPTNPLAQRDGMPGVALRWIEIEGPLYDEATAAGYRLMFGDLPLEKFTPGGKEIAITSSQPKADAERLLRSFVRQAFRRPADEADVRGFISLIHAQLNSGAGFAEAMIAGYTAVLSSPGFLVLQESPGALDDYALAARLAFFLWNSPPDATLRAVASRGELRQPAILRRETERLLHDPKSTRFVEAFLDYWLDLRKMQDTSPSISLYNDYYLDDALTEAALDETRLFFGELLQRDLPARHLVVSDFTFLNERLALHYGVPGVAGVAMRRVALPPESPRGGLLTQASVLKVTANGTTTSPVLRGHWITERILGYETPPPPPVGSVEPDIRGAVTIRQQLEKHRADASCASCHAKMDPPGFALENFDILGGWRDRYRAVAPGKTPVAGFGKNGQPFEFYLSLPVDAAGELPDGRAFKDVRDFKRLLVADAAQESEIARSLVQQLTIFATGSPVRFSERATVALILDRTRASGHGVRALIHELVQSDLFLTK